MREEWMESRSPAFIPPLPPSKVGRARRRWWVGVAELAGELKWNSQICWPPTCPRVPFTQPSILFRLAIGRLHVSAIVNLFVCVIRRDSLILLGSRGSDLFADAAEKITTFPSLFLEENHLKCFGIVVRRRAFTC